MMNWDAIGAVGEIVGAAAVVVSLIYLASQIRTQNREARLAAMHDFSEGFRDSMETVASDGEIAKIWVRATEDFGALRDDEKIRIIVVVQRVLRVWEEGYHDFNAGRLEARIWNSMVRQLSSLLASPLFSKVWDLRREYFDEEFQAFVDGLTPTEYRID